ncbi:hypothetical protein [Microbulbifer discodermiae]|uniref:hypothetical protein n=1 Tax=Microbulbifer sp. 2201CG32-9 TaxID=3232309 RepID=UPI00345C5F5B
MSKRAPADLLDELHGTQAAALLAEVRRYKEAGEGIPPALFAQVNKFLKDNGVDRAITPGDSTDLLDKELPTFDDNVVPIGG